MEVILVAFGVGGGHFWGSAVAAGYVDGVAWGGWERISRLVGVVGLARAENGRRSVRSVR